ncbi:hypothetical protein RHMOL_Rhmol06G0173600 [Rhododendron molle]|uniref:Uncharacterized protein n=1 Tax=Rhododendron molle TaxID=49168 RepID=A0ACC0NDF9_RHOML|nr:hypothetical protein RHMOL_Rhmol06G0173600 [Rhododendron molle]
MIQMKKKKKKKMEDLGKCESGKQKFKPVISPAASPQHSPSGFSAGEQLTATLESGVSLGSGEYFMDVLVGTPPRHYSLSLDIGSDLNWIQCVPCYDRFEQNGPIIIPKSQQGGIRFVGFVGPIVNKDQIYGFPTSLCLFG